MEIILLVAGMVCGVVAGAALMWIIMRRQSSEAARTAQGEGERALAALKMENERTLASQKQLYESAIERMRGDYAQVQIRERETYAEMIRSREESNTEAMRMLQTRFDQTVAKLQADLELATAQMLKQRQTEFEKINGEAMGRIVTPLNEEIERMRQMVAQNTERHARLGGELSESIRLMMQSSDAARISADKLANALSLSNRVQGHWGETMLTQLLTSQGLQEGIHFDTQLTMTDQKGQQLVSDGGSAMRPDVILHLDDNRDIIIDSKVSLTAYLDFVNAETDEARESALKRHIESIQNQVKNLAKKDYSKYVRPPKKCMDYVIMFVPVTAALYAATTAKPDLWRRAMEQNVYIADEQTLYAALRIIDMTWRNIAQAENHKQVYGLANEMLERVAMFLESFDEMGSKLTDAKTQYDKTMAKLKESGQSIPQTARKLMTLGATPPTAVKRRKTFDSYMSDES